MKRQGGCICVLLVLMLGVPLAVWGQEMISPTQPTYPSLKIAGFGDFNFSDTDEAGSKSGFKIGQFVLQFSSALSAKTSVFGETTLTLRNDKDPKSGVERIFIRFDQSDYFKASFGRYHTPINWWNTAFHHGLWLHTSIQRPEMTKFGGKFIPVHFVGGLVEGALPSYGLNINYNFGLGNGRGEPISGAGDAGDVNNNRAWLINLFIRPDRLFGLQAGTSFYRDKITLSEGDFHEWIAAAHIVWQKENPEVIAEYANVNHRKSGSSSTFNSQAYYIQVAYRLPWFEELWKPYYRFEYFDIPKTESVFNRGDFNRRSSIAGLRYDISDFAAIKAEYRNQRRPGQPRVKGYFVQTSFTF